MTRLAPASHRNPRVGRGALAEHPCRATSANGLCLSRRVVHSDHLRFGAYSQSQPCKSVATHRGTVKRTHIVSLQ